LVLLVLFVCVCVQILALSKRPDIARCVVNSIGPSIYGHDDVKMALALAMFSGEAKQFENGHRIRGDINVLVLGDPGTLANTLSLTAHAYRLIRFVAPEAHFFFFCAFHQERPSLSSSNTPRRRLIAPCTQRARVPVRWV
jgi:hypothetical protein